MTHAAKVRPLCGCGCGRPLPRQNGKYFDRMHRAAYLRSTGYFQQLGKLGSQASLAKGSKRYVRHVQHVVREMQALVPAQETFTRAEVLKLCVKARRRGYQRGYSVCSMARLRQVA
jgi:hypothetical protein